MFSCCLPSQKLVSISVNSWLNSLPLFRVFRAFRGSNLVAAAPRRAFRSSLCLPTPFNTITGADPDRPQKAIRMTAPGFSCRIHCHCKLLTAKV